MVDKIRSGITLLEVMISVLIVSIGVFGLLALLPIAGQQAARGLANDRAAVVGRNAVAEFYARGMAKGTRDANGNTIALHWCIDQVASPVTLTPGWSYCIDPMYVTRNPGTGFPDVAAISPKMQRVNLRAGEWPTHQVQVPDFSYDPSASTPKGYFRPPPPPAPSFRLVPLSTAAPPAMNKEMADYVFTAHDDLVFEKNEGQPGSAAVPLPIQRLTPGGARETNAEFSWFATLVPLADGGTDDYILNIAVCQNRLLEPERVVRVNLTGAGVAGGDAEILPRAGQPATDTELRKGQWVVLAGSPRYFRWYRVIYAELNDDPAGLRMVTLEGSDWPMSLNNSPLMIIAPNVLAVFERSVRFGETAVSQ